MKGHVVLNQKEVHRAHVLEQVAQTALTLEEAAKIMQISYRQAKRVYKRWKQEGLQGLAHGNRGRQVNHALPSETAAVVVALHEEVYHNFTEIMGEDFSLSSLGNDPEKIAQTLSTLLQAGRITIAKSQKAINGEPDGSVELKKFIPAVFGRLVCEKFEERTGIVMKQTALGQNGYAARDSGPLINGTLERIRNGEETIRDLETRFSGIEQSATDAGSAVGRIAADSQDQAVGVKQLNESVHQIDQVTQHNARAADTSAESARVLTEQSHELDNIVEDVSSLIGRP